MIKTKNKIFIILALFIFINPIFAQIPLIPFKKLITLGKDDFETIDTYLRQMNYDFFKKFNNDNGIICYQYVWGYSEKVNNYKASVGTCKDFRVMYTIYSDYWEVYKNEIKEYGFEFYGDNKGFDKEAIQLNYIGLQAIVSLIQ